MAQTTRMGIGGVDINCDTATPRRPILKKSTSPILTPSGQSWMSGAVFDGRPISFRGRDLVYFCGQPSYRSDRHLFVGMMERNAESYVPLPVPVIVPDIENRGIDIPTFTVVGDEVIGLYFDDFGSRSTGKGTDADVVVCRSKDGRTFSKHFVQRPFSDADRRRIGLPWLLADDDRLWVYFRTKVEEKTFLERAQLDLASLTFGPLCKLVEFWRNPINIAVTRRPEGYLLFYGNTVGSGIYVCTSPDGVTFKREDEVMLVADQGHEWGWDFAKVAASPDNTTNSDVQIIYTSNTPKGLSLAIATFQSSAVYGNSRGN